jgi:hypothetical protein
MSARKMTVEELKAELRIAEEEEKKRLFDEVGSLSVKEIVILSDEDYVKKSCEIDPEMEIAIKNIEIRDAIIASLLEKKKGEDTELLNYQKYMKSESASVSECVLKSDKKEIDISLKSCLALLVDGTGSMSSVLDIVLKLIEELISVAEITGIFHYICIMCYKDYDSPQNVILFSKLKTMSSIFEMNELREFIKSLKASGGGDIPEAMKTGLFELHKQIGEKVDFVRIIHITDAPPHLIINKDLYGVFEKNSLPEGIFDIVNLCNLCSQKFNISTVFIGSHTSTLVEYAYLSEITGGQYFIIQIGNLKNLLMDMLMGYVDFREDDDNKKTTSVIKLNNPTQCVIVREIEIPQKLTTRIEIEEFNTDPYLASKFSTVLEDIILNPDKYAELFSNMISRGGINLLKENTFLMRMWRKMPIRRYPDLANKFSQTVQGTKNIVEKQDTMKAVAASYSKESEVKKMIKKHLTEKGCCGLIRLSKPVLKIDANIMVELFRSFNKKSSAVLFDSLQDIVIIDEYRSEPGILEIPPNSIPANMSYKEILSLVLSLVSGGFIVESERNKSLLYLCMLLKKSPLLLLFKDYRRSPFIFTTKADGSADYPENFSPEFLRLMLAAFDFLIEDEKNAVSKLSRIFAANKIKTIQLTTQVEQPIIDYPITCYIKTCARCKFNRTDTQILDNGECVYCISDAGISHREYVKNIVTREDGIVLGKMNTAQCGDCNKLYYRRINAGCSPKCYFCLNGFKPSFNPCLKCSKNFNCELKNGMCAVCLNGEKYTVCYKETFIQLSRLSVQDTTELWSMCGLFYMDGTNIEPENMLKKELRKDAKNIDYSRRYENPTFLRDMDVIQLFSILRLGNRSVPLSIAPVIITAIENIIEGNDELLNKPLCVLCADSTSVIRTCHRTKCDTYSCEECIKKWYGENKPGKIFNIRSSLCPCCARPPVDKIFKRVNSNMLFDLRTPLTTVFDPHMIYAWCITCKEIKDLMPKNCADTGPELHIDGFECNDCKLPSSCTSDGGELDPTYFKKCPECHEMNYHIGGCNHAECRNGHHFCFECHTPFETAGETYNHLHSPENSCKLYSNSRREEIADIGIVATDDGDDDDNEYDDYDGWGY